MDSQVFATGIWIHSVKTIFVECPSWKHYMWNQLEQWNQSPRGYLTRIPVSPFQPSRWKEKWWFRYILQVVPLFENPWRPILWWMPGFRTDSWTEKSSSLSFIRIQCLRQGLKGLMTFLSISKICTKKYAAKIHTQDFSPPTAMDILTNGIPKEIQMQKK